VREVSATAKLLVSVESALQEERGARRALQTDIAAITQQRDAAAASAEQLSLRYL
jgi:hypothetical protein